jgi:L-aminopeptidase/D-esterase-like protein
VQARTGCRSGTPLLLVCQSFHERANRDESSRQASPLAARPSPLLLHQGDADGSILIVVATDAPLSDRNLTRLARRALAGLARTGASFADGSGDYALAFSVAESVRRTPARRSQLATVAELLNALLSPLFQGGNRSHRRSDL